jgi:hypothetical protein
MDTAGAVTTADGTEVAVIITGGTGAAVTTNGTTIAAGEALLCSPFVIPVARTTGEWQRRERSRRRGAAGSAIQD